MAKTIDIIRSLAGLAPMRTAQKRARQAEQIDQLIVRAMNGGDVCREDIERALAIAERVAS